MIRKCLVLGLLLLLMVSVRQSATAQGSGPIQDMLQQLRQAAESLSRGDYTQGVQGVMAAADFLKANPKALPGGDPTGLLSGALEYLQRKADGFRQQSKKADFVKATLAQEPLINAMMAAQPKSPRWLYLRGVLHVARAGDGAKELKSLPLAIKDFKSCMGMPDSEAYKEPCQKNIAYCKKALAKKKADLDSFLKQYQAMYVTTPSVTGQFDKICRHCNTWTHASSRRCTNCGKL